MRTYKINICAFLCIIVAFISLSSYGQSNTIKGKVTTFDSIPLINAEVLVMSSKQITYTDSLGLFEVDCLSKDKLKVKAYGFTTRKVKVSKYTKLAFVNLSLKKGAINQEVAVGYGHIKDSDKLNAVSSLNSKRDAFSSYSNMYDLIRGSIPGVEVRGKDIIIRGDNSINYSSAALVVVDGVTQSASVLETLRPYDVKSIDVLKDGATAIYGSRGASGVILITLKKGGE